MNVWHKLKSVLKSEKANRGLLHAQAATDLLRRYQPQLSRIRQLTSIPDGHYNKLYNDLIQRLAELVQLLPASEAHHHAHAGGLLQHSLETAEAALRIRQSYLLPQGGIPEQQSMKADLYTYAVFTSALLHDIGKPLADQLIHIHHSDGHVDEWAPLGGPMPIGSRYSITFRRDRKYQIHEKLPLLLVQWTIPIEGQVWLNSDLSLLEQWTEALSGSNIDDANAISEIIKKADQYSVANNLTGGHAVSIAQQPAVPLHQRIAVELRRLIDEEWKRNEPGGVAFHTQSSDTIWLVSKRSLDELRSSLIGQGQTGIPPNPRIMDELIQYDYLNASSDGKASRKITIKIGDWEQSLTCIGVRTSKLWGTGSGPATDINVRIVLEDGKREESPSTSQTVDNTPPISQNLEQVSSASVVDKQTVIAAVTATDVSESYQDIDDDVPPDLRAEDSQPAPAALDKETVSESVPDENLAKSFCTWLTKGVKTGKLEINNAKAMVHTVPEGLLIVSPRIFRVFAQSVGADYKKVQSKFQRLKINKKTEQGQNIWTYDIKGDRKSSTVKGMIIMNPEKDLGLASLPNPNSHLIIAQKKFLDN
ncbi:MobH family relaxase [Candidatus Thiodiazotropha endoloripes]|uniref:MobH family relaxase n=1 Tax=Candidatus Thiodiazotropha endoloripes TaxID=1818881 RepID=UPI0009040001|nr:MobH family relaxase [Candidatus Thiodiazotropha endoloripes]